ncbi:hypothetical protein [Streptomyces sp. NPDC091371]|uniref:hypothetical protein n=1 Tax=Streptomyces sp. NPDC091371 TaxID=3155303 RepID=UPI003430A4DC
MTSISAGARISSTRCATTPAQSVRRGLVIENLDAVPDTAMALYSVCTATLVMDAAAPSAGRLGA